MKRVFLNIIMICIVVVSLIGCKEIENNDKVENSSIENNNTQNSKASIKISKEEVVKINNEIVKRLKEFYENNSIPYYEDNGYVDIAEITRITINSAMVESEGVDTQGIYMSEYAVQKGLNIDSYIYITDELRVDLSNSIAKEYCEAIVGEKIDFNDAIEEINDYFDKGCIGEFRKEIENDKFIVEIVSNSTDRIIINIDSKYEIK